MAGSYAGRDSDFVQVGDNVYFGAYDTVYGDELRALNLTTMNVTTFDLNVGVSGATSGVTGLKVVGDKIYFAGYTPAEGSELRVLDTTTSLISTLDIYAGSSSSSPGYSENGEGWALIGDKLYFNAYTSVGNELVVVDTTNDTFTIREIYSGFNSSNPGLKSGFTVVGDKLFFGANGYSYGNELWMFGYVQ